MKSWLRRVFGMRCSSEGHAARSGERRKVSKDSREQWEEWQREKEDVERRLQLVKIQTRVIAHVTGIGDTEG